MNILFVVPYAPNLVRVRPFNLIRHLSTRGHNVTVVTLWTNGSEQDDLERLGQWCTRVEALHLPAWRSLLNCVVALPGGEPLQASYSWSSDLMKRLTTLRANADVVHVEHLRGARYGLLPSGSNGADAAPVVWDSVDCISDLFEQAVRRRQDKVGRLINQIELTRTRRYEGWLTSQFDRILVTSEIDKQSLQALSDNSQPVSVLTNGVDLDYFSPASEQRQADSIVFSGKMSYHANESAVVHLVRDVMPLVWSRRPSTRVVIVGKDPSRNLCRFLSRHPQVKVTGTVADIRPYLRRASVAAVPLVYGAGCQNKVLEAMACATPVVTTPKAVSALHTKQGRDVLVADGPEAFAEGLLSLLGDPLKQQRVGRAGRDYVETNHRWDHVAAQLETIYAEVIGARSRLSVEPQLVS